MDAELIIGLCDRFHKLPSEIYAEGTELIRMINFVDQATPKQKTEE